MYHLVCTSLLSREKTVQWGHLLDATVNIQSIRYNGAFNNYVEKILLFFDPPLLRGQFLIPVRGLKQRFFDPLPPYLVYVVIECPQQDMSEHHLGLCIQSAE